MIERARLAQLAWGDKQHLAALQKQYPEGFDIILGADVVYVEEFVPQLFRTARALMSEKHEASMMAAFITSNLASTVLHFMTLHKSSRSFHLALTVQLLLQAKLKAFYIQGFPC